MRIFVLAACVALAGCSTSTAGAVLSNLQGCERHYDGVISGAIVGGSFSGSVKIDCPPKVAELTQ